MAENTKVEVKPETKAIDNSKVREIFLNGLLFQNPILVLFLGMCATLAVTTSLTNAIGMGLSTTAVLICSNVVISLLRRAIPKEVRIACYVVVIAAFVTIVDLMLQAYLPALSQSLGLFIQLIVVNCIILGRAEAFASKNTPLYAAIDGVAMGLGFTLALCAMGFIRELLGGGAILGHQVLPTGLAMIAAPAGGFLVLGCLVALTQYLKDRAAHKKGGDKA